MTGVSGLIENFAHYYVMILMQSRGCPLLAHQRNGLYELYRMAAAFYGNLLKETGLTSAMRSDLDEKFADLTEVIRQIQTSAGDRELQAV